VIQGKPPPIWSCAEAGWACCIEYHGPLMTGGCTALSTVVCWWRVGALHWVPWSADDGWVHCIEYRGQLMTGGCTAMSTVVRWWRVGPLHWVPWSADDGWVRYIEYCGPLMTGGCATLSTVVRWWRVGALHWVPWSADDHWGSNEWFKLLIVFTKRYIQGWKVTKPECLTDSTSESWKINEGMLLKLNERAKSSGQS